jgi:hypothetical protein
VVENELTPAAYIECLIEDINEMESRVKFPRDAGTPCTLVTPTSGHVRCNRDALTGDAIPLHAAIHLRCNPDQTSMCFNAISLLRLFREQLTGGQWPHHPFSNRPFTYPQIRRVMHVAEEALHQERSFAEQW